MIRMQELHPSCQKRVLKGTARNEVLHPAGIRFFHAASGVSASSGQMERERAAAWRTAPGTGFRPVC